MRRVETKSLAKSWAHKILTPLVGRLKLFVILTSLVPLIWIGLGIVCLVVAGCMISSLALPFVGLVVGQRGIIMDMTKIDQSGGA